MPIDYTIEDGLLLARASGVFDDATLLAYVQRVIDDARYAEAHGDLFDMRDVTSFELTPDGLRKIATMIRRTGLSSPHVAIVAGTLLSFGMARMFEMLRDDIEVKVFHEREPALAWLRERRQLTPPGSS
jgi:hypothetical protein